MKRPQTVVLEPDQATPDQEPAPEEEEADDAE